MCLNSREATALCSVVKYERIFCHSHKFIKETKSNNVFEKETSFVNPIGKIDLCNVCHVGDAMFMTILMILVQPLIVSHR